MTKSYPSLIANYLPPDKLAALRSLHESGVGTRAIARELGIARETVKRYLRGGSAYDEDFGGSWDDELTRLIKEQAEDASRRYFPRVSVAAGPFPSGENPSYEREPAIHLRHPYLLEWSDPVAEAVLGEAQNTSLNWESPDGEVRVVAAHGTQEMYVQHECRCFECRQGNTTRMRAYRARRSSA